jgi:hypothetical protein
MDPLFVSQKRHLIIQRAKIWLIQLYKGIYENRAELPTLKTTYSSSNEVKRDFYPTHNDRVFFD